MSQDLKNTLLSILRYRFNLDEDKANEDEIKESLRRNVEFRGTNLWALIFAIFIASIGLNVNSAAVIIGAMLISPLMGPIMGVGLGAGVFDFKLIRYSLKNLFVAVLISITTSAIYFWLTPLKIAQSELLARTSPTIWDVLIALFGGLAGIVASSRKNISNTIPGVAIATALMPPLCTAGYGIGTGNLYYFLGAFYLFIINSVFISIATFLIIRFLKFKPVEFIDASTEAKVRRYIWLIALFTILPSLYLAYNFVQQEIFRQNVKKVLTEVVEPNNYYVINERLRPAQRKVTWVLYGDRDVDSLQTLLEEKKASFGLEDAEFILRQSFNRSAEKDEGAIVQEETTKLAENYAAMLLEKDNTIRSLERRLQQLQDRDTNVFREFNALFGEVQAFSIERSLLQTSSGVRDSVMLVYIKKEKKLNSRQIESWLKARYRTDSVVVVID